MSKNTKKIIWPNTAERFVAFFDIMGFTQMVFRESHDIVKNKLYKLKEIISSIDTFYETEKTESIIRTVLFSDSIMIVSNNNTKDAIRHVCSSAACFQRMCLVGQIPVKGAIAHGNMTCDFDQSIYFGRPLIDAYKLQQDLVLYGTILHNTAEVKTKDYGMEDKLVKYLTPFKSGKTNHVNIDWIHPLDIGGYKMDPNAVVETLYNAVSGQTRIYVDNTLDFVSMVYKVQSAIQMHCVTSF